MLAYESISVSKICKYIISKIYVVFDTWPLCSAQILVDRVNSQQSYSKNPPLSL